MTRSAMLVLGMALSVLLLVLLAIPSLGLSGVAHLKGPVRVQASLGPEDLGERTVDLPGLFERSGVPSGSRVTARWAIDVPEDAAPGPWAVWLERPQFASRVLWDGERVGGSGDIDGTARSERSVLALLPRPPDWQGPHELHLDLLGDYGKGGLIGRMVVGPQQDVLRYAVTVEAERLGLVLLLAALGLVQLLLGASPHPRSANLLFGGLCLALALYIFGRTDLSHALLPDPDVPIRLRRLASAYLAPLALGAAATFDHRDPPTWLWALLGLSTSLALASVGLPMDWLPTVEAILDIALICGAVALPFIVVPTALRRRPGAITLALASLAPVILGLLLELGVTNGLISGTTGLLPALTTFAVGVTVALSLRDVTGGERHVRLVRGSPDGMLGVDRSGRVTDANPAADRLLGRSPLDTRLLDWIVADDQAVLQAQLDHGPDRPERAEIRIRGQERVLESVVTPIDTQTMLVVLRDVTERRAIERSRLQRARGETIALLVGGLAHDFNNMLGTLLAHVGFLQLTTRTAATQARLERMEATLVRASGLTRRLLNLAGGSGTPLAPTSLHDVMHTAADLVRPTLPDRVHLDLDVPEILPDVAGSPTDLEHVFVNLLVNARNAVGRSGTIRVIARPFRDGDATGVICAVEDDGPGVPVDEHERIFMPFVTGDASTGTGLGLAVARQVIREHEGRIWVEDRPGGGARFCVALHDAGRLLRTQDAGFPPDTTILVVEDDDAQRQAIADALGRAGVTVHALGDGLEARALAADLERVDALVTDYLLPGLDGVALATTLRKRHPDLPVLLISAHLPDGADLAAPFMALSKPARIAHVLSHLHGLLSEQATGETPTESWPTLDALSWASVRWHSPAPAGRVESRG